MGFQKKLLMITCFKSGWFKFISIRLGKKYGFDFNLEKNEKIGKLRSFVKSNRDNKK